MFERGAKQTGPDIYGMIMQEAKGKTLNTAICNEDRMQEVIFKTR